MVSWEQQQKMLLIPDCCKPAFIIYGIWVDLWDKWIKPRGSSHSISLSSTEAEECAHHWPWLVGHYSRYQRPAATKKMMEGSYHECQVWWSSPHPIYLSCLQAFQHNQVQKFHCCSCNTEDHAFVATLRYATYGTAGKEEDKARRAAEGTSALCSSPLSSCFTLEWWLCTTPQVPLTSYSTAEQPWGSRACCPPSSCHCSIFMTLAAARATPMGEVAWWDPADRLKEPSTRAG